MVVYPGLRGMQMVACCDLDVARREDFQRTYGIPKAYDDFETALAEEQPDIVHVVTQPSRREWEADCAARAGVKAIIVEKPMAVTPSDLEGLVRVHERSGMEIIVNCQRRYYPQFRDGTIRNIAHNKLGNLYLIRASTKGNMMGMGPHLMDLLMLFLDEARPEAVWATAHTINETDYQATHRAPESLLAEYWFPGDVRVLLDCSPDAVGTPGEDSFWMHLHFDFLGTTGWMHLTQNRGYWYQAHGMAEPVRGASSWDLQGQAGQRDFTQAVADWLDGGPPHLNRFAVGRAVVEALFAAQKSALLGKRISLPTTFTDAEWQALRDRLGASA